MYKSQQWKREQLLNTTEGYADETWLFFRLTPNKTLSLNGGACSDRKNYKARTMVLLACNAHGIDKTVNISYSKSESPNHCKNTRKLPTKQVARVALGTFIDH